MQRTTCLLVASLSIVALPVVSAEPISFGTPAVIEGTAVATNTTWLLIVTSEDMDASVSWSEAFLQNFTRPADYEIFVPFVIGTANRAVPLMERNWTMGPNQLALAYGTKGTGHILVEAQAIRVQAAGRLHLYSGQGESVNGALPDRGYYNLLDRPTPPESVHLVSALAHDVEVIAQNVSYIQWSGGRAMCANDREDCPTGAGGWDSINQTGVWMGGAYIEAAHTRAGAVSIKTRAATIATGGTLLELSINGTARFPEAWASDCDCRRSLTTEGNVTLSQLQANGGGLAASFGAVEGQAFRDELLSDLLTSEGLAIGVVVGVAGLGSLIAWKIAIWLLSRDPLANPRRRDIYEHIRSNPGIHFRGIADGLQFHRGNLSRHLLILLASRTIVERRVKNTKRFFENHGMHDAKWQQLSVLQDPLAREVLDWIRKGTVMQAELVARGEGVNASRRSIQRRLTDLQAAGIVKSKRTGRTLQYIAM